MCHAEGLGRLLESRGATDRLSGGRALRRQKTRQSVAEAGRGAQAAGAVGGCVPVRVQVRV